jgi:hypothetical protein
VNRHGETVDVLDCARRRYDRKRAMLALGSASQCLLGGLFLRRSRALPRDVRPHPGRHAPVPADVGLELLCRLPQPEIPLRNLAIR